MNAIEPTAAHPTPDAVPKRRRFLIARRDGDGLMLRWGLRGEATRLNKTASAIWGLCDGRRSVASILVALDQSFQSTGDLLRQDVMTALAELERQGRLSFAEVPPRVRRQRKIDLREIRFYVINCKADEARRDAMSRQLSELGLQYEFVVGTTCKPG